MNIINSTTLKIRDTVAEWLMRVQESSRQLKIVFWGVTALSTLITATKDTFLANYTLAIVAFFIGGTLVWAWFYDWSKMMKYQQKSTTYRKQNFLNPESIIRQMITARQFAALGEWMKEEKPDESLEERMMETTEQALKEYKNGMNMDKFE